MTGYFNSFTRFTFKGMRFMCFILFIYVLVYSPNALAQETKKQVDIDAPSAVAVDAQTGKILYGKNPHIKLPPASTTKLVTVMVALEKLDPEHKVTISRKAARTPSVSPKLVEGEVYKVRDLVYLALMRSVNSAAVALAEATAGREENFVKLMNDKVQKIGAKDTRFINASGLPGAGQYTTVYDLTKIMSHALAYPLIKEAVHTRVYLIRSENGKEHFIQNTNQLLWAEDNMIGGKTGYTRRARHCFVSAYKVNGRLVYTAILGDTNREQLWKDTQQLVEKAEYVLTGKDEPVVKLSEEKSVMPVSYKKNQKLNKKVKTDKKKVKKISKTKRAANAKNNKRTI
ncbi:D-alanyl-D-alanine carboxypeptidase family protein [Thermodesulfovibrio yellowstonii]|uniref:D-alanyl-D-alanine carboxypeptidase n=1 Tax=Thermodesulfovibrio yellowstonii TaxID=28262 RepID=A0A9W6GDJ5_9BACT|nr:D-alanyl-D-alanine carboxypeptidase family protein [Thermodesulfovibrio islandicus]GLI53274.1 D-alanyl-D-alanine carboxypeptidase [Thermodesulfovibrio islandicus]